VARATSAWARLLDNSARKVGRAARWTMLVVIGPPNESPNQQGRAAWYESLPWNLISRPLSRVELSVAAGSNYIGDFVMALVIWKIVQPSFSDQLTPLGPDYHWMIGAASALSWLCVVALVLVCFWYANFRARHRFPPEGRR